MASRADKIVAELEEGVKAGALVKQEVPLKHRDCAVGDCYEDRGRNGWKITFRNRAIPFSGVQIPTRLILTSKTNDGILYYEHSFEANLMKPYGGVMIYGESSSVLEDIREDLESKDWGF